MNKATVTWTAATISMLAWFGSIEAHHSSSMFDLSTPIWVKAVFVHFERVNPHSRISLEETTEDGRTVQWTVEGPSLVQLDRAGVELGLDAGDVVEICGFALKERSSSGQPPLDNGRLSPPFVHGHVLVMPDGEKRLWGSYGRLGECIESKEEEQKESWANFLNTVRDSWCRQRANSTGSTLLDEINSRMTDPCR